MRFKNLRHMRMGLRKLTRGSREALTCYNFEVTFIKKAPKRVYLSDRLTEYDLLFATKKEHLGKQQP